MVHIADVFPKGDHAESGERIGCERSRTHLASPRLEHLILKKLELGDEEFGRRGVGESKKKKKKKKNLDHAIFSFSISMSPPLPTFPS